MSKKSISLTGCDVEVIMKVEKAGFDRDNERTCDFKFSSGCIMSTKILMMEADARALAAWILENTKEPVLQ